MRRGSKTGIGGPILAALVLGGLVSGCDQGLRVEDVQVASEVRGRCVPVRFTLHHDDALAAEILVEVDVDGSGTFRPATPASAAPGAQPLATSAKGTEHTFLWDSEADVPRDEASGVVVRVSGSAQGQRHSVDSPGLRVSNVPGFVTTKRMELAEPTTGAAAADFDQDGLSDLAVTMYRDTNNLLLLRGTPDGSLALAQTLTLSEVPYAIVSADFNGDQRPDVAAVSYSGTYFVFLNDGRGQLIKAEQVVVYGSFTKVASADLDGDKLPDLALLNEYDGVIRVLRGAGDGTFTTGPTLSTRGKLDALALGDFNADGWTDIAASSSQEPVVTVMLGQGEGVFASGTEYATSGVPDGLAVGDLDGDGKVDLVTAPRGLRQLDVLLGRGDGGFALAPPHPLSNASHAPVLVDLNRDGRLDVLVSSPARSVQVLLGEPSGGFSNPVHLTNGDLVLTLGEMDSNGDGSPDVFFADGEVLSVGVGFPPDKC